MSKVKCTSSEGRVGSGRVLKCWLEALIVGFVDPAPQQLCHGNISSKSIANHSLDMKVTLLNGCNGLFKEALEELS